jgi:hypothetical protein
VFPPDVERSDRQHVIRRWWLIWSAVVWPLLRCPGCFWQALILSSWYEPVKAAPRMRRPAGAGLKPTPAERRAAHAGYASVATGNHNCYHDAHG